MGNLINLTQNRAQKIWKEYNATLYVDSSANVINTPDDGHSGTPF